LKLVFVNVSSRYPEWLDEVIEDYKKKLSYWFTVEVNVLKPTNLDRNANAKKKSEESAAISRVLKPDDYVIACDEGGRDLSSKEFAKRLESILGGGKKRIVIIIGGAYGLEVDVLNRCDLKLSLSKFVLNHHLAMAVICEQTYRAMTIIKGIKYHND
jgi:23S rRNA (pseudouridine1915-N3)-methyltransferase